MMPFFLLPQGRSSEVRGERRFSVFDGDHTRSGPTRLYPVPRASQPRTTMEGRSEQRRRGMSRVYSSRVL
jgi:hypothetical protein